MQSQIRLLVREQQQVDHFVIRFHLQQRGQIALEPGELWDQLRVRSERKVRSDLKISRRALFDPFCRAGGPADEAPQRHRGDERESTCCESLHGWMVRIFAESSILR